MEKMKNKTKKIFSVVIASILLLSVSAVAVSVIGADNSVTLDQEKINPLGEVSQSGELGIWSVIYTDMWSLSLGERVETSSTTYVDMPNTNMTITTYLPTDLVIIFSAECYTSQFPFLYIRCMVDEREAAPGTVYFTQSQAMQSHAFNFYVEDLPAGEHTIKIQWKIDFQPPQFGCVWDRTLNVIANGAGHT